MAAPRANTCTRSGTRAAVDRDAHLPDQRAAAPRREHQLVGGLPGHGHGRDRPGRWWPARSRPAPAGRPAAGSAAWPGRPRRRPAGRQGDMGHRVGRAVPQPHAGAVADQVVLAHALRQREPEVVRAGVPDLDRVRAGQQGRPASGQLRRQGRQPQRRRLGDRPGQRRAAVSPVSRVSPVSAASSWPADRAGSRGAAAALGRADPASSPPPAASTTAIGTAQRAWRGRSADVSWRVSLLSFAMRRAAGAAARRAAARPPPRRPARPARPTG